MCPAGVKRESVCVRQVSNESLCEDASEVNPCANVDYRMRKIANIKCALLKVITYVIGTRKSILRMHGTQIMDLTKLVRIMAALTAFATS